MKYWTFFCNPFYWEIDLFLANAKTGVKGEYFINRHHEKLIKPGDFGVIRVGYDKRSKKHLGSRQKLQRGVYAIVQIIGAPYLKSGTHGKHWIDDKKRNFNRYVAPIRYDIILLQTPILLDDLMSDAVIKSDKFFITGFPSATMPLSKDAFDRILLYVSDQNLPHF